MSNQFFTFQMPQSVFQLHELDEKIMLWIQAWSAHWTLEVEGQPLLDSLHPCALDGVAAELRVLRGGRVRVAQLGLRNREVLPAPRCQGSRRGLVEQRRAGALRTGDGHREHWS